MWGISNFEKIKKSIFIDNRYMCIYNEFEHEQYCVKAIGTSCLSANSVLTRGAPIGVKDLFRAKN